MKVMNIKIKFFTKIPTGQETRSPVSESPSDKPCHCPWYTHFNYLHREEEEYERGERIIGICEFSI